MDNVTWTRVMSSDNNPELFTGNTDGNTVVRHIINPHITAKYFRVNTRMWQSRPCLRFDLGGCKLQPMVLSRYALASLPSMSTLGQPISLQPPDPSAHRCGIACHRQTGCVSFRFDATTQNCHGYTSIRKTSFSRHEIPYYYNTGNSFC
ncbi:uncharacterized protein LOC110450643 [Mizuhopecten yessoensis]|nr:uncharacterized protein LOC110450643 [Mizuhopecten yessoensis]